MKFEKDVAMRLYQAGKMPDIAFMQLYADEIDRINYFNQIRGHAARNGNTTNVGLPPRNNIEDQIDGEIDAIIEDILDGLTKKKTKR